LIVVPQPVDIDAIRARNAARRKGEPHADGACVSDVHALIDALERAQQELARLREDVGDLRASAELWADFYTATVDRANAGEASVEAPAHERRATDADRRRLEVAADTVAVLREALEAVVQDCAGCAAERRTANHAHSCDRCARAVDALRKAGR
jgi:hypothetical protein